MYNNQLPQQPQQYGGQGNFAMAPPNQSGQYNGFQHTGGMHPQATGFSPQQTAFMPQQQQNYQALQQPGYQSQTPRPNVYNPPSFGGYGSTANMQQLQAQRTGGPSASNGYGGFQQEQNGYQGFGAGQSYAQQPQQQQPQMFQPIQQQSTQQPFVPQQTAGAPAAAPKLRQQKTGANIPSTRLSFVLAADQQKFEDLFAKAVGPYKTALPGDEAKTILMRSGLAASQLSRIWALSDTTRSGQLLFPEFVLAMHLCNTAIRKGSLPERLDDRVRNEVSSMVDHISFTAADTVAAPSAQPITNAPNFSTPQKTQNLSNVSLMAQQMQPAQMGFYNANLPMQAQMTGYQQTMQAQLTGYQQPIQAQMTGYQQPIQAQATGYQYGQGLQPGLTGIQQSGLTGTGSSNIYQGQQTGMGQFSAVPLTMQPTGRPGEWGFVHAPQGAVQGMQALGAAMMPGAAPMQGGFQMPMQQKTVDLPWAITKEEKAIYDTIFRAWDKKNQGFLEGPIAIEVFGSSGVGRQDLEYIWALADADDKGKLNADEFSVALHLVYRKLNGYEVPAVLPPELIPPSTRNFGDSISQVKNMLQQDASSRNGPTSYMKSRSFRDNNANRDYSKDGTVYKHNDSDVGYVSSARRRAPGQGSDSARASPAPEPALNTSAPSISELKKRIKEKQILLDAIDQKDDGGDDHDDQIDSQARKESDELIRQIRKVQARLDSHQNHQLLSGDGDRERSNLSRQLQGLVDKLPEVASQVRSVERRIQEASLAKWSKEDQKLHPGAMSIVGTGPGGQVTEADKRRAKTKAMMAARTAALTGKALSSTDDNQVEAASQRQAKKVDELSRTREGNEQMIRDIEESAQSLQADIKSALNASRAVAASEHERRRWNDAVGVEPEVRDLIKDLKQHKSASQIPDQVAATPAAPSHSSSTKEIPSRTATPTYNSFGGAEDRAAYVKQAAEARMTERLAALGIRPTRKANRDGSSSSPIAKSQADTTAEAKSKADALRAEEERQEQKRQALEAQAKKAQEDEARARAESTQQTELEQNDSQVNTTAETIKTPVATMKPADSRQAKLAQLRAEREARLAEEERLERELADENASSSSESEAEKPPQRVETNPYNRMKSQDPTESLLPQNMAPSPALIPSDPVLVTKSSNPFHKFSGPLPGTTHISSPSSTPVPARPPSTGPPTSQRTSAPRAKAVRKNSDDWSVVSKDEESSSDEEGPSPADLAARLFSGGMQPQRTGAQTPMTAQRTGSAPLTSAPPGK